MNKKVFISMLLLCICFLTGLYVLKGFFPEEFMMSIQNDKLITIGTFIDNHRLLYCLVYFVSGLISDYLYFGAVCRQVKLNWKLLLIIIIYDLMFAGLYAFGSAQLILELSNIIIALSSTYMIFVPMLFTKEIRPLSITYTANAISQLLSLSIRSLPLLLITSNILTTLLMSIECYFWLLLCFIIFNYKGRKRDGNC